MRGFGIVVAAGETRWRRAGRAPAGSRRQRDSGRSHDDTMTPPDYAGYSAMR